MAEVAVIMVAVILGAFVKGVTGSGLPVVAIPVMTSFVGIERAVVIMAIPGMASNLLLIRHNIADLPRTQHLAKMVVCGVAGVAVGTYLLTSADEEVMALILASVIGLYLALNLLHPSFTIAGRAAALSAAPVGFAGGILQGGTGVSSPLLSPYLHAYRLPRGAYVISITVIFQVFGVIQVIALYLAGLYSWDSLAVSLGVLLPIYVGLTAGIRYGRRLSVESFNRWILVVLAATAVELVADAVG